MIELFCVYLVLLVFCVLIPSLYGSDNENYRKKNGFGLW